MNTDLQQFQHHTEKPFEGGFSYIEMLKILAKYNLCFNKSCPNNRGNYKLPISIEWSNLEGKYYERRSPIHIDIQLHKRNDDYYAKFPLIGHSILDHALYQVYSKENKLISEYLQIPTVPVDQAERIKLVLDSQEYGIRTAKSRLIDSNYKKTDPNRILWISMQNYVWAIIGERYRKKDIIYKYLSKLEWFKEVEQLPVKIKEIYYYNESNITCSNDTVTNILEIIINNLMLYLQKVYSKK